MDIAGDEIVCVTSPKNSKNISMSSSAVVEIILKEYINFINILQLNPKLIHEGNIPHLKKFDIFSACPELHSEMNWKFLPNGGKKFYFSIGARASTAGLHKDKNNCVLAQLFGSKRVFIFSPDQRELLYPNSDKKSSSEFCDVDVSRPDYMDTWTPPETGPLRASASGGSGVGLSWGVLFPALRFRAVVSA